MKITKQLCLSIGLAAFLGACSSTGLSMNPSLNSDNALENNETEEAPGNQLTNEELNALVQPPVTRTVATFTKYYPVKCNWTNSKSCTNIDLSTDTQSTNNQTNYYMIQNKHGECLSSKDDKLDMVTCDISADYQKFRMSFLDKDASRVESSYGSYDINRYEFAIIPKLSYKRKIQAYGSSSNPETYWLKKQTSDNYVSQGGNCDTTEVKCKFYFFPATAWNNRYNNFNYQTVDSDGTTRTGNWFFMNNKNFYHSKTNQYKDNSSTKGKGYCIRQRDGHMKIDDRGAYECDVYETKMLWRLFRVESTN